jgi:exopolysaccharide biosynthesis protein
MKNLFVFILLYTCITSASGFNCTPQVPVTWTDLSDGVSWTKYDLSFTPYQKEERQWESSQNRSVTVRAFKIDLQKNKLLFQSPSKDLNCNPATDRYIEKIITHTGENVIGAINCNFFVMPSGGIQGIAIDENKVWSSELTSQTISSSGILYVSQNLINLETKDDFIQRYGSVMSPQDTGSFNFAVQAYPKLLIDGEMKISDSVLNSRRSRTSIGTTDGKNEIILVTIDARAETSKTGMTLFEYAHFIKNPNCGVGQTTALNLDGGGSSAFAIPQLKIYEQADRCRHLGNILTIQKR